MKTRVEINVKLPTTNFVYLGEKKNPVGRLLPKKKYLYSLKYLIIFYQRIIGPWLMNIFNKTHGSCDSVLKIFSL